MKSGRGARGRGQAEEPGAGSGPGAGGGVRPEEPGGGVRGEGTGGDGIEGDPRDSRAAAEREGVALGGGHTQEPQWK